jgi:hypothetical protein
VIAAAFIIVASAITGYVDADLHPYLSAYGFERQLGALVGLALGVMAAGVGAQGAQVELIGWGRGRNMTAWKKRI